LTFGLLLSPEPHDVMQPLTNGESARNNKKLLTSSKPRDSAGRQELTLGCHVKLQLPSTSLQTGPSSRPPTEKGVNHQVEVFAVHLKLAEALFVGSLAGHLGKFSGNLPLDTFLGQHLGSSRTEQATGRTSCDRFPRVRPK
jgi:hypothetical protein